MSDYQLYLMDPDELRPHERIGLGRAAWVIAKILKDGEFTDPILVDKRTKTILDGHHRRFAAKFLGLKKIPCWTVDYFADASIELFPRRDNIPVDKEDVVRRAQTGKPYPRKTTRHSYQPPSASATPLKSLREKRPA